MTCIGKDPRCPCQDGDACHYKDCGGTKAWPVPKAEPPPEWPLIKNILDEYGLDAIAFVAEWKAAQQKAEPTCPDCKALLLYECVACSSNNYPPKQQAEPGQERITHITWDERGVRTVNGIPDDSPRRKELSASEILNMMPSGIPAEYDGELMEFARAVEAKLKERNGY